MKLLLLLIFAFACAAVAGSFAASGEIQGDGDGIRNIATWQRTNRRTAIFDAGGFSAENEAQNATICSLMQTVNYSAIAMGYSELRFSAAHWEEMNRRFNLPLLATNVRSPIKIFERIRTAQNDMKRNTDQFAIISIVGNSAAELAELHSDFEIEDPREALKIVLPQIPNEFIIVLIGHCEPALLDSLINEFPRISFGIQGYRKVGAEPSRLVGHKRVLHSGGADKIAVLDRRGRVRWREFFRRASTQPRVQAQVQEQAQPKTAAVRPVIPIEIFAMSGCPHSDNAVKDFLPLMSDENFSIRISFIGDYQEEKIWLAVQDLFPERFRDFLFLAVVAEKNEYMKIAETVGLTQEKFENWKNNYTKSSSFYITVSPTIVVDNRFVNLPPRNIIRNLCHLTKNKECFGFADTINVKLILPDYKTPNLPVDLVLERINAPLTEILIDTLELESEQAQELLERFSIVRLPAVIANDLAWNWGHIQDGVYFQNDFRANEIVVISDSAVIDEIRIFIAEKLPDLQNWYLMTDDDADGWQIWYENRNLISGRDIADAKTLLKFYAKTEKQ